jgi:hypothetical protein
MLAELLKKPLPMEGRFNMLPIREQVPGMGPSLFNKRELALPGLLAGAVNAVTAPGRAAGGLLADPKEEAANFAGTFTGGGLLGSRLAGGVPGGSVGMGAYHGSRHKFDAFDSSKIGVGEGSQVYGHGLYFAENPTVAKSYMSAGSKLDGLTAEPLRYVRKSDGVEFKAGSEEYSKLLAQQRRMALNGMSGDFDKRFTAEMPGNLYHVDIPDEAVGKMLEWDKPLKEQPESVRRALDPLIKEVAAAPAKNGVIGRVHASIADGSATGGDLYRRLAFLKSKKQGAFGILTEDMPSASEALRNAGVPGLRYLDGGSRAAGGGTRNLVLFDDKLVKIKKRE